MNETAQKSDIKTGIGKISVYIKRHSSGRLPLIFLHGIYFDHHLWDKQVEKIEDRTVISVDMPLHGHSRENIKPNWTLNDCAEMLIEILDSLKIPKVIAIGHSWGSMTILRAAHKDPEKFAAVGLCNMPFQAATKAQKVFFGLQHLMLVLRGFYANQSAKALFSEASLKENPALLNQLKRPMSILSNKQVKQIDKTVLKDADDTTWMIETLKVKAIALKGDEDFVPTPPGIETMIVKGGHVSPLEESLEVSDLVSRLIDNKKPDFMTKQVQYTSAFTIIEGKVEEFKRVMHSIIDAVEKNERGINAYQVYLNAEENKAFIVEWFKNSEAILLHLANVGPLFPELLAIAPILRLEVFGNLTIEAEDALKSIGAQIFTYHEGFIRGDV